MRTWLAVTVVGVVAVAAATAAALVPAPWDDARSHDVGPAIVVEVPTTTPSPPITNDAGPRSPAALAAAAAESNILPEDYVGPKACEHCHAERYQQWSHHPHSKMNQNASATSIAGDFNDARLKLPGGDAVFRHVGDAYTMTLERGGRTVRSYRVTRTVGSRFMQFYIGTQIEGPEPRSNPAYTVEHKLPFGFLFRWKRWLPENYFDDVGPEHAADGSFTYEPFDRPRMLAWASSCMACHNTYPYAYRLGLENRSGFPREDLVFGAGLRAAVARTVDLSHTPDDALVTQGHLVADKHLVTVGISCESCHFGGRAHVQDRSSPSWLPVSDLLEVKPRDPRHSTESSRLNPYAIDSICTQCHTASVATYPNGAGVANSREARDLASGACSSAIRCNDCHDPHKATGRANQPVQAKHLAACVSCHAKYAEPAAVATHTRHAGKGDVTCLDCHMPRISQGLDEVVRSHRISSPSDGRMLSPEQPNACNLCHLDKSIAWTVEALETGWGAKPKVSSSAMAATTRMSEPAGRTWLSAKSSYTRLTAAQAWSRSPLGRSATPMLVQALEDPHAVNRVFATLALERVLGTPLGIDRYDPTAEPSLRANQIATLATSAHAVTP